MDPLSFLLLLLACAIAILSLLKLNDAKAKKPKNLPPSPPKLPIIGNLHQLGVLPHRSLHSLSQKHGPLMLLRLGRIPTLVVSSAEMAEEVLKNHDAVFASRPSTKAPRELLYGCINMVFSPYGEYWRQVRKLCVLELLTIKRVNSFRFVREEEVGLMMERISRSCSMGGAAVNMKDLVLSLTNGIITRVAFGKKYEGEENDMNKFAEIGNELSNLLLSFCIGDFFPLLGWVDVLTGLDARLKKSSRDMDAFLDQVVDDHLTGKAIDSGHGGQHMDLVDFLLKAQKDSNLGINLTRNNIKALLLDMYVAGTDTSALTIEWAMTELARHPTVMEKAQAEVTRVMGHKKKVDEEDLNQLHYLKCVIKETLRLHPVGPLLVPRESISDVTVRGYHIPAKTWVFVNAWAIGRDPMSWENADDFLPDRFVDQSTVDLKGQDFHYLPFGAGRRGCPGVSFGVIAVELALANLLYWFDWQLPIGITEDDIDMSEVFGLTLHKKLPLCLVPKHRFS